MSAPELAAFCAEAAVEAPEACVGALVAAIVAWGIAGIIADNAYNQRANWMQGFIGGAAKNSPNLNTLAIATYYGPLVDHASGVGQVIGDCGHTHQEIQMELEWGATQGVEIYTVGDNSNCCVEKWGDGGWTNWGYYGDWAKTTTSTGSTMMCVKAQPPPQPPAPKGSQRYSLGQTSLVTVNGVVGRLLEEGGAIRSYQPATNSLYKFANYDSGPYWQATVQTDGNFVVYFIDAQNKKTAKFWTNTGGKTNNPNWELVPQHDGNLVLYHSDTGGNTDHPVWASQTSGINVSPGWVGLSMQQDGNLVLYVFYPDGSCSPIWASAGNPPNGRKDWPGLSSFNSTSLNETKFVVQGAEEL